MIIRKAQLKDAEAIAKNNVSLALDSENKEIDFEKTYSAVKDLIVNPEKGFYFVVKEKNEIIGELMITFEWSDWNNYETWWIQSAYVKSDYRRKGVFKKLYDKVIEEAKSKKVGALKLYVHSQNEKAIEVYEKIGMNKKDYLFYEIELSKNV